MSKQPLPWDFHPQLTEERLTIIAKELLRVLNDTYAQLSTSLDNNYTRSTCTFGRQWQLLIDLCLSGQYDWLHLTNAGLDITFTIDTIPVRFFTDDPANPKKDGFYRRNPAAAAVPDILPHGLHDGSVHPRLRFSQRKWGLRVLPGTLPWRSHRWSRDCR